MTAIGVDLVETKRIARTINRFGNRFLHRVYTESELAHCRGRVSSLAARWAAKEAVAKALGTGIGAVRWQDVEVINQSSGQPQLRLSGQAKILAEERGLNDLTISLSHTQEYAIAFVMGQSSK